MTGEVRVLLELRGVSRRYGERLALSPIDLRVDAGSCLALLGPNGSGKSTLLRITAGRDMPTSGQVRLEGAVLDEDDPAVRAKVAVVADAGAFYPDLTVREHLELVARAHGVGEEATALVEQALSTMRLGGHVDALPATLSSGQQQALQLAAALVRPRRLMVLDEPEQRLDPDARKRLADLLVHERAHGRAIVLATHHVDLAASVADEVVLLDEGEVVRRGRPREVLA